jgi:cell division protein FtsN
VARSYYRSSSRSACPPPWLWLLAGALIGVCLTVLAYVYGIFPPPSRVPPPVAEAPPPTKESPASKESAAPVVKAAPVPEVPAESKPSPTRFEFYEILPNPNASKPRAPEISPPPLRAEDFPAATDALDSSPTGDYMLQVASFRNQADADKLRAQLNDLGFHASLQSVVLNQQEWFRTRVGPFASEADAMQAQARLKSYHFQAILVRP